MAFKDWYDQNRDALNRKRRRRYKKDATYRKRQLANTRNWRKARAAEHAKLPPVPKTVFTIGEAAEQIRCEDKTIRNLEKAGLIPVSSDGVHHRRFNAKQIGLIKKIVEFRKATHYQHPQYQKRLTVLKQRAHAQWS